MQVFDWTLPVTMQSAAVATGNGTDLLTANYGGANIFISGTFSGTVTFEASHDGTNWYAIAGTNRTSGTAATTATVPGLYRIEAQGINRVRARVSAWTSGDITAVGIAFPLLSA